MSERNDKESSGERNRDRFFERNEFNRLEKEERKKYISKIEKEENVKFKSYDPKTGEMIFVKVIRNSGDRDKILIPSLENISYYDALLYAYKNIPSKEVKETFKSNLDYLSKIDPSLAKVYKRVRTIRDYLNATGKFDGFYEQLKSTIEFVTYDLNLNGYSKETFEQCVKRANALIDNVPII
ncbi:hypothetical protein [Fusobacterium periodonticum]|uniref:Uncharacterized protein n=1 Tax=Fusobacterium periodonticum ATCC 33693 TaxID=546275 RepID=D4CXL7_9FUSO|nr:hypothetical protein [Fusobacterium periodonticum]EFE85856.1 hypothetical protein FUSPEROL_02214 [Fusobacterium periodonticum ATCC 33693]